MHEIGLVDDILYTINSRIKDLRTSKVKGINILIGELEHITPEHFEFHFRERTIGTPLGDAKLNFKKIGARFRCKDCNREFSAEEGMMGCPACKSKVSDIVSGSGIYVEFIDITEIKTRH
ncbi:MAG: hydrogenase maturation nickel metallochaperone HypA [Candidatus Omnitrophica bacterium]|nr:hydrogenase maturation nickel metallochaperone HypA [Candidatus Omnitrophota bacterium]MBU1932845.1 hydrogenase maturation nickel metallochaperone HypA [Candidatus Omnitrophota bacterium]